MKSKENIDKKLVALKKNAIDEYIVAKLEDYIYELRDAMLDFSIKFPDISTIKWYCQRIQNYDQYIYVVELFHMCWCYVHPEYLFNSIPKNLKDEELLEMVLSQYDIHSKFYNILHLKEEYNHNINPLLIKYYKSYQHHSNVAQAYGKYMEEVYRILRSVGRKWNIDLNKNFTIPYYIKTDKSPQQLKKAFEIISKDFKCCEHTTRNLQFFLSIFDTTISEPKGTIQWSDRSTSRNHEPCIASIGILFKALGIKLNYHNKSIISKHFTWENGTLSPDQIRDRRKSNKDSEEENRLDRIYNTIFSSLK